jgi:hypothetical protein
MEEAGPIQPQPYKERMRAPDLLESGAATFRSRNAIYGDTYLNIGYSLVGMFPDGVHLDSIADFNRFATFLAALSKLQRYAAQLSNGGHVDSAHDLMVYGAMLEELTK